MKRSILVAFVVLPLLATPVHSAPPARGKVAAKPTMAPPKMTARKAKLLGQLTTTAQQEWNEVVKDQATKMVNDDPKVPADKRPGLIMALSNGLEYDVFKNEFMTFLDKRTTEKDLAGIVAFVTNPYAHKLDVMVREFRVYMAKAAEERIANRYPTFAKEFQVAAAPSPVPSAAPSGQPLASPSPIRAPRPAPSPVARKIEVGWLTRTIWKIFPETNQCGCAN